FYLPPLTPTPFPYTTLFRSQHADGSLEVVDASADGLLVHDAHHESPGLAFALSRLTQETAGGTPMGVFRDVERPVYDELMSAQRSEEHTSELQSLAYLVCRL